MAGWSGNVATLGFAKQSAKGVTAAVAGYKTKFTGGNMQPVRTIDRLNETSGTRDVGAAFLSTVMARGTASFYLRQAEMGALAFYALGANVDSGTMPNFLHTSTPVDTDLPWTTWWRMIAGATGAGSLIEKYVDSKVDTLKVSGGAGQPLQAEVTTIGLTPSFLATDDATAITTESPYTWDQVTITKGGGAISTCQSVDLTIANNLEVVMGNGNFTPFDLFPGERQISGTATILYEDVTKDYKQYHYATTGAGAASVSRTLFQQQLIFTFTLNANVAIAITLNNVTYTEVPVEPQPGGAPIMSALAFSAEPNPGGNSITIVTKNTAATVL